MATTFKDDLATDLVQSFFNTDDFGESVTLTRNGENVTMLGLYDTPVVAADNLGIDVDAISHYPRLFVRQLDLPDGKPRKGDIFELASTSFHSSISLVALDYVFEKDGVVMYRCKEK